MNYSGRRIDTGLFSIALLAIAFACLAPVHASAPGMSISDPTTLTYGVTSGDNTADHVESATDGQGNWVVVWSSNENLNGSTGSDRDVLISRSTDNGVNWTPRTLLNNYGTHDTEEDYNPCVYHANGTWLAVWDSCHDLNGTEALERDIFVASSTDCGATWSASRALNANARIDTQDDAHPRMATDGKGNWVVVWHSKEDLVAESQTDFDIFVASSMDNGNTWTSPTVLNSNAADDSGNAMPWIATDGAGNWVVVWESTDDLEGTIGVDQDIFVSRSTDNGLTWSPAEVLNNYAAIESGQDDSPCIEVDAVGNWIAVWHSPSDPYGTAGSDSDIYITRSSDAGVTWSPAVPLKPRAKYDGVHDFSPRLANDGEENWIAVWFTFCDDSQWDYDTFLSRSFDGGLTWTPPGALNTDAQTDQRNDRIPHVLPGANRKWLAFWRAEPNVFCADISLLFNTPAPLNAHALIDTSYDTDPHLATDGLGHWIAAWGSSYSLDGTIGTDGDILIAHSTDNADHWTSPSALNIDASIDNRGDRYDPPQIEMDRFGNAVAVWTASHQWDSPVGGDLELLVAHSTDHGDTWSSPTILNSTAWSDSCNDEEPRMATDGAGNWVVVWETYDGDERDVYVSQSRDNGETWTTPTALNPNASTNTEDDRWPCIATDRVGTWLASWDAPGGALVYARSTDNGLTWTSPTLFRPGDNPDDWIADGYLHMAADSQGNWLAVWIKSHGKDTPFDDDPDLFSSLSTDGGYTWSAPIPINSNARDDWAHDSEMQLLTDRKGFWLVVWTSNYDFDDGGTSDEDILMAGSRNNGASWTALAPLNANARTDVSYTRDYDRRAHAATDGAGNWIAAWEYRNECLGTYGTDSDIFFAKAFSDPQTWQAPSPTPTPTPIGTPTPVPPGRPVIVAQPQDVCVEESHTARFSTRAGGSLPLTFFWQRDRSEVSPTANLEIVSGDSVSTLTITDVAPSDAALYRCLVANPSGTALTREALLSVAGLLEIVGHPHDITLPIGTTGHFRVGASGTPPIHYTWFHDGATIVPDASNGADTNVLTVSPILWQDSGLYWCRVHGGYPAITEISNPARLRILPAGVRPWWELMR